MILDCIVFLIACHITQLNVTNSDGTNIVLVDAYMHVRKIKLEVKRLYYLPWQGPELAVGLDMMYPIQYIIIPLLMEKLHSEIYSPTGLDIHQDK